MPSSKYTREILEPVVASSTSYSELLRNLGLSVNSGSLHNYLKWKVAEYKLDTSHFVGLAWAKIDMVRPYRATVKEADIEFKLHKVDMKERKSPCTEDEFLTKKVARRLMLSV